VALPFLHFPKPLFDIEAAGLIVYILPRIGLPYPSLPCIYPLPAKSRIYLGPCQAGNYLGPNGLLVGICHGPRHMKKGGKISSGILLQAPSFLPLLPSEAGSGIRGMVMSSSRPSAMFSASTLTAIFSSRTAASTAKGMFRVAPPLELKKLETIFRHKVFCMLIASGKISREMIFLL
jgi:hypothetical protein